MSDMLATNHINAAIWAADSAEQTLHYFERRYPDDAHPRQAIEAARSWTRGERMMFSAARQATFAAHAAAREATDPAAQAAARAAGHAAAIAHVATHAAHAAKAIRFAMG